ncbi:hypothetical protein LOD99_10524 [Oopsacas minuta]|uniref:Tc1-like transposase DDE domain-containing protein n=1 Tax=Oopsacas minuta TaxID=111878 RepID=A0AAV7JMK5_9METZ|nr:hypothetical protein LOD99_6267 [Oopsacas minuta]KAI6660132.1 hypothetical protein LOD99_10524 [Oopsacas minuta]
MSRRKLIYRTIKRYKDTGSTSDRQRSGRPTSATTTQKRKVIRSRIQRNPQRSMRKMALELKISRESVRTIVKSDMGLFPYKKRKVHFISPQIKEKRLARSKALLARLVSFGLDEILFSDEKLFTVEQAYNRQNDRVLSLLHLPYHKSIDASKEFSILNPIVRGLGKTMFNNRPFLFQQDGAPAHTAKVNQQWLRNNIPDFISKEEWPPSSPDLNPMDFSLWSILETNACTTSHKSIKSLKTSLPREWAKIPQEKLRAAVESVPKRLRAVIKKKGGYIEQLNIL